MRDELVFVRGAVATKDLIPVLTHFHIYDGRIQGGNGKLTTDIPCKELEGINITVPSGPFLQAVDACDGKPDMSITDAGKLRMKQGSFKVFLPLAEHESFPMSEPDTEEFEIETEILEPLRALRPFVGEDATRQWSLGVLYTGDALYATNNLILAKVGHIGQPLENPINIPAAAIDELLRIRQEPTKISVSANSITFWFGDAWLKSVLLNAQWPDVAAMIPDTTACPPVPEGLRAMIERIRPFCPDKRQEIVRFKDGTVSTSDGNMNAAVNDVDVPDAAFFIPHILIVLANATHADFSVHPDPCPFRSDTMEGIIMGINT